MLATPKDTLQIVQPPLKQYIKHVSSGKDWHTTWNKVNFKIYDQMNHDLSNHTNDGLTYTLYLLISNKKYIKIKKGSVAWVYRKYTSRTKYNQVHKEQKSSKPWTEIKERKPNTTTQSKLVLMKKSLRTETVFSDLSCIVWRPKVLSLK